MQISVTVKVDLLSDLQVRIPFEETTHCGDVERISEIAGALGTIVADTTRTFIQNNPRDFWIQERR